MKLKRLSLRRSVREGPAALAGDANDGPAVAASRGADGAAGSPPVASADDTFEASPPAGPPEPFNGTSSGPASSSTLPEPPPLHAPAAAATPRGGGKFGWRVVAAALLVALAALAMHRLQRNRTGEEEVSLRPPPGTPLRPGVADPTQATPFYAPSFATYASADNPPPSLAALRALAHGFGPLDPAAAAAAVPPSASAADRLTFRRSAPGARVVVVPDFHGDAAQTCRALVAARVLELEPSWTDAVDPADPCTAAASAPDPLSLAAAARWTGRDATLVHTGDFTDRGDVVVGLLALLRSLGDQAGDGRGWGRRCPRTHPVAPSDLNQRRPVYRRRKRPEAQSSL